MLFEFNTIKDVCRFRANCVAITFLCTSQSSFDTAAVSSSDGVSYEKVISAFPSIRKYAYVGLLGQHYKFTPGNIKKGGKRNTFVFPLCIRRATVGAVGVKFREKVFCTRINHHGVLNTTWRHGSVD